MPNKNPQKAFVLDPRTLLKPEFDKELVSYMEAHFKQLIQNRAQLSDEPIVYTIKPHNLQKTYESLKDIAKECQREDGRLDIQKFIIRISKESGVINLGKMVEENIVAILKSPESEALLDRESFKQISDNGKVILVLGSEANPAENFLVEAVAHTVQADQKGKRIKETGIGNIFLGDQVIENDIILINTGDQGKREKPDKAARVVEITKGLADIGLRPMVVETDLNTLTRLEKEGKENKSLLEKQMSLALIGPARAGELSTKIKRFATLKEYTTPPSRQEGKPTPAVGIPPMG